MRVSIALATYNGAKYLQEQLESFTVQTRLPDELVVCDDGSTDDTFRILERFSQTAPFVVRVFRNDVNLGYALNFAKALGLCEGDLVFLSDQDDVWKSKKIDRVVTVALSREAQKAGLFLNDAIVTNESLKPIADSHFSLLRAKGKSEEFLILGCCMAIRRDLLDKCLPVPDVVDGHDKWISDIALALGEKWLVVEPLQFYRRHGGNASGGAAYLLRGWEAMAHKVGGAVNSLGNRASDPVLRRKAIHIDNVLKRVAEIVVQRSEGKCASEYVKKLERARNELWFRAGIRDLPFFRRIGGGLAGLGTLYEGNYRCRIRKLGSDLGRT